MKKEQINEILQIRESFELPEKMMDILLNPLKRTDIFDKFMSIGEKLDHDWFTEYFEEQHANKDKMSQDFTPPSVCKLLTSITRDDFYSCCDICSGTGGLTIAMWNKNPNAYYHTEEFSQRAFPLLLFNMAIRNMDGEAYLMDALKQDAVIVYEVISGEKYSDIKIIEKMPLRRIFDICVSNPPYSQSWEPQDTDEFSRYGTAPKSKADYAFIQHALYETKESGQATFILPHGVLFRGQKEGEIRKAMLNSHIIKQVIGLPEKLFLNTKIPVCILQFEKNSEKVFVINAEKEYEKAGKTNFITEEQLDKIKLISRDNIEIDGYSKNVQISEIIKNEYNLNIPRYCASYTKEEIPDLCETIREIAQIDREIKQKERELIHIMQDELKYTENEKQIKEVLQEWSKSVNE